MTCTNNRGRHFSSHDLGSLSVARHNSRENAARRAVSLWRMDSLDVGIVKGGKEYAGEEIVGGQDSSSMVGQEGESERVTTSSRSCKTGCIKGRGDVTFVSHALSAGWPFSH